MSILEKYQLLSKQANLMALFLQKHFLKGKNLANLWAFLFSNAFRISSLQSTVELQIHMKIP